MESPPRNGEKGMQVAPRHYKLDIRPISQVNQDDLYHEGWKVVVMAAHPDGEEVILFLEKVSPPQEN